MHLCIYVSMYQDMYIGISREPGQNLRPICLLGISQANSLSNHRDFTLSLAEVDLILLQDLFGVVFCICDKNISYVCAAAGVALKGLRPKDKFTLQQLHFEVPVTV